MYWPLERIYVHTNPHLLNLIILLIRQQFSIQYFKWEVGWGKKCVFVIYYCYLLMCLPACYRNGQHVLKLIAITQPGKKKYLSQGLPCTNEWGRYLEENKKQSLYQFHSSYYLYKLSKERLCTIFFDAFTCINIKFWLTVRF